MVGDASTRWTAPSSRGTSWTGVRTDASMKSFQRDASSDMQQVYGKCSCTERFAEDVTLSRIHFASHLRNEMKLDDLTGEMTGAVTGKMGAVYVMVLTIYRFSRFCAAIVTFCGISGRRIPVSHKTSDFCLRGPVAYESFAIYFRFTSIKRAMHEVLEFLK